MFVNERSMLDTVRELVKESENLILEQLNDLVSRGLLVVERGPMSMYQEFETSKLKIHQTVKLTLKDKEYIEQLEAENKKLKEEIQSIKEVFRKVNEIQT